ncbi:HPr family phosphocarrier protein [Luteimonas terricola]|uniref:Phosphocarrier protein HPr n=1 Tax=Luteimonas terricola TaxID=645597 RepID=A0ABQ2EGX2_9GAMM|nr:HPr family phosphocarrier protein [Luteimonas terricola]GGK12088.1 phosphocarrier protein HPr [Luteimonas terricola]
MIERELTVANRLGLHARATARLVQLLSGYDVNATLTAKGREVNAKSIMGVMLLAAGTGTAVTLRIEGADEAAAAEDVCALFERRFDEDS